MAFAVLYLGGIAACPESPRYYLEKGDVDTARKNLGRLRGLPVGDEELEEELQTILHGIQVEQSAEGAGYLSCFKSEDRYVSPQISCTIAAHPYAAQHALSYSHRDHDPGWSAVDRRASPARVPSSNQCLIRLFQVNFFFSYGVKFFSSAGITDSFKIQVILSAVNVITTFPGLWAVEHLGRRKSLFIGSAIMFVGQIVAGSLGTACTLWTLSVAPP